MEAFLESSFGDITNMTVESKHITFSLKPNDEKDQFY